MTLHSVDLAAVEGAYGQVAKYELELLLPLGTSVGIELDDRQSGLPGLVAYVFDSNGLLVNEQLLRIGVARLAPYAGTGKYADYLRIIEDSARSARRGLWATSAFASTGK